MWRSRYSVLALLTICILFFVAACDTSNKTQSKVNSQSALWEEYISSHTTGLVSRDSNISVRFVGDVATAAQVGKSAEAYIEIIPKVKASVTFSDTKGIVIVPSVELASGAQYNFIKPLKHQTPVW